ncbi:MAG TPA: hypothetical protein VIB82_04630, partial [Caulobacteraceae bacterium]
GASGQRRARTGLMAYRPPVRELGFVLGAVLKIIKSVVRLAFSEMSLAAGAAPVMAMPAEGF